MAGSRYGAAGSLIVVLLWIYYSAQIFTLGTEFTKVYAFIMAVRKLLDMICSEDHNHLHRSVPLTGRE